MGGRHHHDRPAPDLKGTYTQNGCSITYTAHPRTTGQETLTYLTKDTASHQSPYGSVTVNIVNRPPVARDVNVNVRAGESVQLALGGSDPDPEEGVTCSEVAAPRLGRIEGTGCTRTYVAGEAGGVDQLTYTVADEFGGRATGTISVAVTTTRPTATAQQVTAHRGTPLSIALTGTDPQGRRLTCDVDATTAQGKGTLTGTGCERTYTAAARTSGTDTFTYTVGDAAGLVSDAATVTITIANRAPSAPTVAVTVLPGDSTAVVLGGTDPDPGEGVALTCTPTTGPTARGRVSGTGCYATYTAGTTPGSDSFTYSVRDTSGATATGRVDVTIAGTAPAGCTAGEPQDARYVCRTYTDLLGRTASAADKAYWLGRIRSGENRAAIIKACTGTPEYRTSVVRGIWQAYLGTRPDAATEQRWVAELGRGANPDLVRQEALASAAFLTRAGGTPEGFIEGLHQQLLRRPATATEVTTLAAQLRAGTTRSTLVTRLLATTDADAPTVAAVYERFLRRSPPSAETDYWVGRLQRGESELALIRLIVASAEYLNRA